jgi:glycosyltransferase involved in cell wall biosynthesis
MSEVKPFISICIPSYNRPNELYRLLKSIDEKDASLVEIVIREDNSPAREEVRRKVEGFKNESSYTIQYIENESNFGYDKNIRMTGKVANGTWVIYMGDDDVFNPGELHEYIEFLKCHPELGYVLRRYKVKWNNGDIEDHRFYKGDVFFAEGEDTIVELFRRSVSINGFTFRKECFNDYDTNRFDGTLLFQLYIQSTVCLKNKAAYCDIPFTLELEGGIPYFGSSENEKDLYTSGSNTVENSINFLKQTRILTQAFDEMYGTSVSERIINTYAKYSYGYLIEHRDDGVKVFKEYAKEIKKIGMGNSVYFYIYYYALLILGTNNCKKGVRFIKKVLGKTPRL